MELSSKRKDLPHCHASTSSINTAETSTIFTMKSFTTTKIVRNLEAFTKIFFKSTSK